MPSAGSFWWWALILVATFLVLTVVVGAVVWWRVRRLRRALRVLKALGWRRGMRGAWGLARDPRTPWAVRMLPVPLFLYLAMPFDLVPDFIPVLGQMDDVLIVAGIAWLVLRLTPPEVLRDHFGDDFRSAM